MPTPSSGVRIKAKGGKPFHGNVALFSDPHTKASAFTPLMNWGDQSTPTAGQVRRQGNGRYAIMGTHRYAAPGVFQATVTIRDAAGQEITAQSTVT